MSRFASQNATGRFVLGPCACDGTPHDEDYLILRTELGTLELVALEDADAVGRMRLLIVGWNLQEHGQPAPIDDDHLRRFYTDSYEALNAWLLENVKVAALPKAPAAPSRNGSLGSGSPDTPTTQARP